VLVLVLQELQERLVQQVHRAQQVLQVHRVQQVLQATQVLLALLELLEPLVWVQQVLPVLQELLVRAV
jgi:hypothetical protein